MKNKIKKALRFMYYKWWKGYCPHMCYKCEFKNELECCKVEAEKWWEMINNF